MQIDDFKLERYFAAHEFRVRSSSARRTVRRWRWMNFSPWRMPRRWPSGAT